MKALPREVLLLRDPAPPPELLKSNENKHEPLPLRGWRAHHQEQNVFN
jgi:hypothetical protein